MEKEIVTPLNPGLIQPEKEDSRNVPLSAIDGVASSTPPTSYFADISMLEVNTQGLQPSCVAEATSKMKEWQEYREDGILYEFSSRRNYALCKKMDNWDGDGTYLQIGMKVLNNDGVSRDSMHEDNQALPFDVYKDWTLISSEAMQEGQNFKALGGYAYVSRFDKNALKEALVKHGVMLIGMQGANGGCWSGQNFDDPKVTPPVAVEWGHAVMVYGYSGDDFWFLNSWGKHWGRNGTAYFNHEEYKNNLFDGWVAVDVPSDILDEYTSMKFELVICKNEQYIISEYGEAYHVTNLYTLLEAKRAGLISEDPPTPVDSIIDSGLEFAFFPHGE